MGEFEVRLTGAGANWTLALTVQDVTWTPETNLEDDLDKRLLWTRTFSMGVAAALSLAFLPGGVAEADSGGTPARTIHGNADLTRVDIAPKVKLEPGKALYLVAYENSGTGTCETSSYNMRLLFQRSGRRR